MNKKNISLITQIPIDGVIDVNLNAYREIFYIENYLRGIIITTLNKECENWWNILKEDSNMVDITEYCEKTMNTAGQTEINYFLPELYYANLYHLIKIITYSPFWKYFSVYFGSQSIKFKNRFKEVISIRNNVMHSRPIMNYENDLMKTRKDFITKSFKEIQDYFVGTINPKEALNNLIDEVKQHEPCFNKKILADTNVYNQISCLFWWRNNDNIYNRNLNKNLIDEYYSSIVNFNLEVNSSNKVGSELRVAKLIDDLQLRIKRQELIKIL